VAALALQHLEKNVLMPSQDVLLDVGLTEDDHAPELHDGR